MKKQIAIITGASKGIGRSIAQRLADDGIFVLVVDVDKENGERVAQEIGRDHAAFFQTDISEETQVMTLFQFIEKAYERIDVLVNNAGIIRDNLIWNMDTTDFDLVTKINLRGSWLMCREAAKKMKEQKSGRIINISSRAWMGNRGQTNYSASKAGIIGLTRTLAKEWARFNIAVNCVAPGGVKTQMTASIPEKLMEELLHEIPFGRLAEPEEIASVHAFLASDEASYITGQIVFVDGGLKIGA